MGSMQNAQKPKAKQRSTPPRRSQERMERRAPTSKRLSQTSRRGQWRSSSFRYESTRESHLRRLLGAALRGAMGRRTQSLGWRESEKPLRAHSLRRSRLRVRCTFGGSTRRAALGRVSCGSRQLRQVLIEALDNIRKDRTNGSETIVQPQLARRRDAHRRGAFAIAPATSASSFATRLAATSSHSSRSNACTGTLASAAARLRCAVAT